MPRRPVTISHTARVAASPHAAYALVADARRRPQWLRELTSTEAPIGLLEEGDRFHAETSLWLHVFAGASEVVRAQPDELLVEDVVVGAHFTSTWEFRHDEASNETTVAHVIALDFPTGPLGWLERWVLRRRLAAMQRAGLRALADTFTRAQPE